MKDTTVGLIGLGEMGCGIGGYLVRSGVRVISVTTSRSHQSVQRSITAGIEESENLSELCDASDFIFSIIPPDKSQQIVDDIIATYRKKKFKAIFCDLNAISPQTSRTNGKKLEEEGIKYIDGGIIGGPPDGKVNPRVYLSGAFSAELKVLDGCGMDVRVMGGSVGQASALKMCYASVTKGLIALMTGALVTANKLGVYDSLLEEFEDSQSHLHKSMNKGIPSAVHKAYRWVGEMFEISDTYKSAELEGNFHKEAAFIFDLMAKIKVSEPEYLNKVIDEIAKTTK